MQQPPSTGAYIVTGPTSGIGLRAALALATHGPLILVGRNRAKLDDVRRRIEKQGGAACCIVCDLAGLESVRHAAAAILALNLPIAGVLNNAGMRQGHPTTNAADCDLTFATNYLGPCLLTEALMPHLRDGARILCVVSAVEDPARKPAVAAGFRGGRFVSIAASARGAWQPGGSVRPGFDAYATSKQALLAATLAWARTTPRLTVNAIEPGVNPTTGLGGGDAGALVRLLQAVVIPVLLPLVRPFMKILSTPQRAGRVIAAILTGPAPRTGVYYDEGGQPMTGSDLAHDAAFQDRVIAETRSFLAQGGPDGNN